MLSLEGKSLEKIYNWISNCNNVGIVGAQSIETSAGIGVKPRHFKEDDDNAETWKMNGN